MRCVAACFERNDAEAVTVGEYPVTNVARCRRRRVTGLVVDAGPYLDRCMAKIGRPAVHELVLVSAQTMVRSSWTPIFDSSTFPSVSCQ